MKDYKSDQEIIRELQRENARLQEILFERSRANRTKKEIIKCILFSLNSPTKVKLDSLSIETLLNMENAIEKLTNKRELPK